MKPQMIRNWSFVGSNSERKLKQWRQEKFGNQQWPAESKHDERHKFAYLKMKNSTFARFERAFFNFCTFRSHFHPLKNVK